MTTHQSTALRCRTCLNGTDNTFHSLQGKLVKEGCERSTLAGFLWKICKMDNASEKSKRLPQQICSSCLRKLKISFSFVTQVEEVNNQMMARLGISKDRDAEISVIQEYDTDDNDMEIDSIFKAEESYIDCSKSFQQFHEDPISISSKASKQDETRVENNSDKCKSPQCDYVESAGNDKNKQICKNECHREMKAILHNMMSLQRLMNANLKNVKRATQKKKIKKQQGTESRESVASWFPILTAEEAQTVEDKLKIDGYSEDFVRYLRRNKDKSLNDALRAIFDDDLMENYNLDGRLGKLPLLKLNSIINCLREVYSDKTNLDFFKAIRRYICLCHNRCTQKRYTNRKKLRDCSFEFQNLTYENCVDPPEIEPTKMQHENEMAGEKDESDSEETLSCGSIPNLSEKSFDRATSCSPKSIEQENSYTAKIKEIPFLFPLITQDQLLKLEENILDTVYSNQVCEHLKELKAKSGNVDGVMRKIFTDELITKYNFDGLHGGNCIRDLNLVSDCLLNAFSDISRAEFLTNVRSYIALSHSRTESRRKRTKNNTKS
ncbi:uncharacterized protein LOC101451731 isoform X1 [Ceratitis capitata]|nr:uncharacterized protein LOC101451731 isoform X1 [Ceratitis capitata]